MKKVWLKTIFLFFLIFFFPKIILKNVYATKYSLFGPSETLTRGQTVTFTINIDTLGETINSAATGMDYETQYLEYINTIPGDAFPSLTTTLQEGGKLIFQASSAGFNGSGVFAQVNFKIIAQAPGETKLCVLWEVPQETITSTPAPQTSPTQPPPSSPPSPPPTGQSNPTFNGLIIASIFIVSASIGIIAYKKLSFEPKLTLKKTFSDGSKNKQSLQQESIKRK